MAHSLNVKSRQGNPGNTVTVDFGSPRLDKLENDRAGEWQAGTLSHCTANTIPQSQFQVSGNGFIRGKIYQDSILPSHPFLHQPQV